MRELESRVKSMSKKQKEDAKEIAELKERIAELERLLAALQGAETRELDAHETMALAALERGDFEVAVRLFTRSGQRYEKMLLAYKKCDVKEGEEKMRDALQQHLMSVAPEICFGINGLSQNSFQLIVAIIGKHTVQESLAIAAKEKAKKKKFVREPRSLTASEEQRKRDNATAAYHWLESVFDITEDDLKEAEGEDHRVQLGGLGMQTIGIESDEVPSGDWFSKRGAGTKFKHVDKIRCMIQSTHSPKLVGEDGKVTQATLNNRSKAIRDVFHDDPDQRPLHDRSHWWWPKIKQGSDLHVAVLTP